MTVFICQPKCQSFHSSSFSTVRIWWRLKLRDLKHDPKASIRVLSSNIKVIEQLDDLLMASVYLWWYIDVISDVFKGLRTKSSESPEVWTSKMLPMSSTLISPRPQIPTSIGSEGKRCSSFTLFFTSGSFTDWVCLSWSNLSLRIRSWYVFFFSVERQEQITRALLCLSSLTLSLACCQRWRRPSQEVTQTSFHWL